MGLAFSCRKTERSMKDSGKITKEMALEHIFGKSKIFIKDSGRMIRCMARESITRETGKDMKDNL